ncbi:cupin domain-containing protein [Halocatena marina]|uniref:cupin domain-containing protein n=1 Tax=Halocatena marina TaxID=2934937 RepID=UPI0022256812|nr:cupin domain-containing protein [Halocatena marina]
MERAAIDDVERDASGDDVERRRLSDRLDTSEIAINQHRIGPGSEFASGLHTHMDQEEVFFVLEGEATFETLVSSSPEHANTGGEITVKAGEAVRFAPGDFQSGKNEATNDLVVIALGAPRDSEDVRIPFACPTCDHDGLRIDPSENVTLVCPDCGDEHVPRACPDCGHDDLRAALSECAQPIVVCSNCRAEFESPPLQT